MGNFVSSTTRKNLIKFSPPNTVTVSTPVKKDRNPNYKIENKEYIDLNENIPEDPGHKKTTNFHKKDLSFENESKTNISE